LFSDLNKGDQVTKGLKKVTADMQTHKNPELRGQVSLIITEIMFQVFLEHRACQSWFLSSFQARYQSSEKCSGQAAKD
jgi:hypothetical protein